MQDLDPNQDQKLFFMRMCEIFEHLTSAELESVASQSPDRTFKAGESVFANREEARAFYLIKQGKVKLVRVSSDGHERIEDILFPCDVFGLFFDDEPAGSAQEVDLRAEALMHTVLWSVDRAGFEEMIQKSPKISLAITRTLVDRLRESQRRLDRLYFDSSRSRLAKHLIDLAEHHGRRDGERVLLELPLNQEELGELIGASRVTVNQLLGEFKREGMLESSRGIYLLQLERLRTLV